MGTGKMSRNKNKTRKTKMICIFYKSFIEDSGEKREGV